MATLSNEKIKKKKQAKWRICIVLFLMALYGIPYITGVMMQLLESRFTFPYNYNFNYLYNVQNLIRDGTHTQLMLTGVLGVSSLFGLYFFMTFSSVSIENRKLVPITDKVSIPKPAGNGEFGKAWFATDHDKSQYFFEWQYSTDEMDDIHGKNLGLVVEMIEKNGMDCIKCIDDDIHAILIAATRSGKTRGVLFQTIWQRALTGKSLIATDPKGELHIYTAPWLKANGYDVLVFDLLNPAKGNHHNFMYFINEAVDQGDIPTAIDKIWDIVSIIVGEPKGETLWNNGQASVIATAMCLIAMEAPKEYRNMTNVYHFIGTMFREDDYGDPYLNKYFEILPQDHPAREIYAIAEVAHQKTRSSFITSALASLKDFTNYNIAEMTSCSDYNLRDACKKPTAIFLIVPDEKSTLYTLAVQYIGQAYIAFTEEARKNGGRVKNEVDFYCEEFGQYPKIPAFGAWLSVGAGRGLRFLLVLQDYQQLEEKYKEAFKTIKNNCKITTYISGDEETAKALSERLGTYTIEVANASNSTSSGKGNNTSSTSGAGLQSRKLLLPEEIGLFERPYSLVFYTGKKTSICMLPDLSDYYANDDLGMGSPEFNQELQIKREAARAARKIGKPNYWHLLEMVKELDETTSEETEKKEEMDMSYLSDVDL